MGRNVALHVRFDAEQVCSQLMWHANLDNSPPNAAYQTTGPNAASVWLQPRDQFSVIVYTSGLTNPDGATLTILGASLTTIPHVSAWVGTNGQTKWGFSPPSPFANMEGNTETAVVQLSLVGQTTDENQVVTTLGPTRIVQPIVGRWKMSLVLTASISQPNETDPLVRVFHFDPECEVGTGIDPQR